MKRITTLMTIIILFLTLSASAQAELFGVSLSDTSEYVENWQHDDGMVYKSISNSYMDIAVIETETAKSLDVYFLSEKPTALKFTRIRQEIENRFGKPTITDDYIPDRAKDDIEYLSALISMGKAEISRIYEAPNGDRMYLSWNDVDISVLMYPQRL